MKMPVCCSQMGNSSMDGGGTLGRDGKKLLGATGMGTFKRLEI